MVEVYIEKINEAYIRVISEPSVCYELRDEFTFEVPGAKHMPSFKSKVWDGKIRLYNVLTGLIYAGLRNKVESFCLSRDYTITYASDFSANEFSLKEAQDFVKTLNLPMVPRDYQLDAFVHAIRSNRALFLSPTASGKSLIIYLITRYLKRKTLIIVPNTGLVEQMKGDFIEYGLPEEQIHCVYAGQEKEADLFVTISTWQSLYKLDASAFKTYDVVIGDEAHGFKAKSLVSIMMKLPSRYRFGLTGTLDGTETHQMVLEGLFGPLRVVTTTSELIEAKHVSELNVKCILLNYPEYIKKAMKNKKIGMVGAKDYYVELDYLISSPDRNRFIKNLALSLKGNTLVLFKFEKHGQYLNAQILQHSFGRPIYYVFGNVASEDRDRIRKIVETEKDAIIVASVGTFATGINIKSLRNIIFTSPTKDKIRILQAIGRTLRRTEEKTEATLYDLADDLSWKKHENFTLRHFKERIKLYDAEQFSYKTYRVALKIDVKETIFKQ